MSYGVTVAELTGDHQLSKEEIAATQVRYCFRRDSAAAAHLAWLCYQYSL